MNAPLVSSTTEAYLYLVKLVVAEGIKVAGVKDPLSVGSNFGLRPRTFRETLCSSVGIVNPRRRLLQSATRKMSLRFAFANFLWTINGSRKASTILGFNAKGERFTENGLFRCAIGYRMEHSPGGSQLDGVIALLRKDPTTRRAVIQFYSDTDSILLHKDTPCPLSIQFFVRQKRLHAITTMRSQSALMVLPYDLFLFTMLHEVVAVEAGYPLGIHYHCCNSLHIYSDEMAFAKDVLRSHRAVESRDYMGVMPANPLMICRSGQMLSITGRKSEAQRNIHLPAYWRKIANFLKG